MQSLQPQKASACTETRHTMYRSLRSVLLVFEGKENSSVTTHLITVVKNDLLVPQPFPFLSELVSLGMEHLRQERLKCFSGSSVLLP